MGRVACAPAYVGPVIAFAVLHMQMRDPVVMLSYECRGILIAGCIVTDIKIDYEAPRHIQ